jgi:hypothetical protein
MQTQILLSESYEQNISKVEDYQGSSFFEYARILFLSKIKLYSKEPFYVHKSKTPFFRMG